MFLKEDIFKFKLNNFNEKSTLFKNKISKNRCLELNI